MRKGNLGRLPQEVRQRVLSLLPPSWIGPYTSLETHQQRHVARCCVSLERLCSVRLVSQLADLSFGEGLKL